MSAMYYVTAFAAGLAITLQTTLNSQPAKGFGETFATSVLRIGVKCSARSFKRRSTGNPSHSGEVLTGMKAVTTGSKGDCKLAILGPAKAEG